ncbi:MAG: aryl-alcohol dehydrogenase-like predicted oxidoreductase [Paraglaciecola sp.]|jgi:aryl-alcohol dehydrogenase-like predicted oxidoreductase
MALRTLAAQKIKAIGLGCMNLSHAYGQPPAEPQATRLLLQAIDLGVDHFDTAALYGFGHNEKLVGKVLKPFRQQIFLASKCGMTGVDGKRVIDGRPQTLRATVEQSLQNLQTDVIDLYYLHRWDKSVPIEDSVGELARMLDEGKIKAIGLSEVSAPTLQKAHLVHPIAAVQSEYSLWSRNPEIAVLKACQELDTAFVAFSPLGRGFLSGEVKDVTSLVDGDIRKGMPRFQITQAAKNHQLLSLLRKLSLELECSMAQLSLAWLLQQGEHIIPIPGTTQLVHLQDNMHSTKVQLNQQQLLELNNTFAPQNISGPRYPEATQHEIDTEEFC